MGLSFCFIQSMLTKAIHPIKMQSICLRPHNQCRLGRIRRTKSTKCEVEIPTQYEHAANNIQSSMQVGPRLNVASSRATHEKLAKWRVLQAGGVALIVRSYSPFTLFATLHTS